MFMTNYSCSSHGETVLSMLPLYKVTPAISALWASWETEEMVTCEKPFVVIIAVVTAKNSTVFSSFLRNRRRRFLSTATAAHNPKKSRITAKKSEKSEGKRCFY